MSVTAAQGFLAAGVHCGIRRSRDDLALVRSTVRATGAGMFTVNRMQAAPVALSKRHLELAQRELRGSQRDGQLDVSIIGQRHIARNIPGHDLSHYGVVRDAQADGPAERVEVSRRRRAFEGDDAADRELLQSSSIERAPSQHDRAGELRGLEPRRPTAPPSIPHSES